MIYNHNTTNYMQILSKRVAIYYFLNKKEPILFFIKSILVIPIFTFPINIESSPGVLP